MNALLALMTRVHAWYLTGQERDAERDAERHGDAGQATVEYALVLLGAALVALLVVAWATTGGGAGKIGRLFDRVLDAVLSKV